MNKVVFITGAGAGMGKAAAMEMSKRGYAVAIVDLLEERARKAAEEIVDGGGQAIGFAADISNKDSLKKAVEGTIAQYGRIDAVYANAGMQDVIGDVVECDEEEWLKDININVNGTYLTAHLTIPYLIKTKGSFLATASDAGIRPARGIAAYNTSKAAIIGMVRSIAIDFGHLGVRANVICPGTIETDYVKDEWEVDEAVDKAWHDVVPLGRYGDPSEVAKAAAHLMTDESSYTSGLVYSIDGASTVGYYPMMMW